MDENEQPEIDSPSGRASVWKIVGWGCAGVIAASVIACVAMAFARSRGLVEIQVTALEGTDEPRDLNLPFKRKEALPDYELVVLLVDGNKRKLGARPDTSARKGLTWKIGEPISVSEIAGVRLQEQDKVISDAIAEVQVGTEPVTEKGYLFEFTTERSMGVGVRSFFRTPIGMAIAAGFCIAVIVLVLGVFA